MCFINNCITFHYFMQIQTSLNLNPLWIHWYLSHYDTACMFRYFLFRTVLQLLFVMISRLSALKRNLYVISVLFVFKHVFMFSNTISEFKEISNSSYLSLQILTEAKWTNFFYSKFSFFVEHWTLVSKQIVQWRGSACINWKCQVDPQIKFDCQLFYVVKVYQNYNVAKQNSE